MPRSQIEYLLKGVYLGLLLFAAVMAQSWSDVGIVTLGTFGGLAVALLLMSVSKLRQGYRVNGRLPAFLLFLLLDSPSLAYVGILAGTIAGAVRLDSPLEENAQSSLLLRFVIGGAVLGLLFSYFRILKTPRLRLMASLLLAMGLVAGALYLFGYTGDFFTEIDVKAQINLPHPTLFGATILLGIPVFYLLTFAGREEESEVEIAVLCAALGFGVIMVTKEWEARRTIQSLPFLVPIMLYFFYTMRILPALRVFKHALRGLSYARVGQHRLALMAFRRALQLDPNNKLAREGFWGVHSNLDPKVLAKDPQTLALVDFDLCVQRAGSLLLEAPTAEKLDEANRLFDLVLSQRPGLTPRINYWRAVAYLHARDYERAAAELTHVISASSSPPNDPQRWSVLVPAWQLGLVQHEEMRRRVGLFQLAQPGRRIEAIRAVERHLAENSGDADAWNLKRLLYQDVTEAEYLAAAGERGVVPGFDHAYVQQLGLALINDAARWQRGVEYLQMAAHGLPEHGPTIHIQIAQAMEKAGNIEGAWHSYALAKHAGRTVGPKNLAEEDRHAYFGTLKMLGEDALQRGEYEAAIDDFRLYSEYERAGLETLRTLADLYVKKGDALSALHFNEKALVYNAKDKDLLERKDQCYISIEPEELKARLETYGGGFDSDYCMKKSKSLLDVRDVDVELLDWARRLIELALVVKPESLLAKAMLGRTYLRLGETDKAVALLEAIRKGKPEKFASRDDEEGYYQTVQLLGRLYLDTLGKPEEAVKCLIEYRQSPKSGADTYYRLGQAYEQLGDAKKAIHFYELVEAYDGHPLAYDARAAISRLKG